MKDSELTRDEVEILENYKPICRLFSKIKTIEHNLELAEDYEDIEYILSDIAYYEEEFLEEIDGWKHKFEKIKYDAKNFEFVDQRALDQQEFYNDHIRGWY